MVRPITLDDFLELKEKSLRVFVFTLDHKVPSLEFDTHWIYHLNRDVHLVRCSEEDFKVLDMGIYPKVMICSRGKELAIFNGIPELETLQNEIRKYL